ncbi:MAG: DNA replication complex GINS family protein [Acidilobaceae archaeon]|nr:DNA replication complex GINS family protein [Acidilobaceae archaeon]
MAIKERLELAKLSYLQRRVRVQFLKDYPALPTPSGIINARRGDELELPRWQARLLRAQGYVEVREAVMDVGYINQHHFKEKRGESAAQLVHLQPDFYLKAGELVALLNSAIRESPSSGVIREREGVERNLVDLAEMRLGKMLRLAQAGERGMRERMTPEELALFEHLLEGIEAWKNHVRLLARGEGLG